MSALPPKSPATVAPFSDALGYRVLGFDKKSGDRLEMLRLRPQLASSPAFEAAVRERQRRLTDFRHAAFARVRQIDRPANQNAALAIVSNYADGQRLSDFLRQTQTNGVAIELIVAVCMLQQMVSAVAQLHAIGADVSHGALNPERLVVTPAGRIVVTEYVAGAGLAALALTPQQAWQDYRLALPPDGSEAFTQASDVYQLGYLGLTLVSGKSIYDRQYPPPFATALRNAEEITADGRTQALHPAIVSWLTRALRLGGPFASAVDAQSSLDEAIASAGLVATPDVVADLVARASDEPEVEPATMISMPSPVAAAPAAPAEPAPAAPAAETAAPVAPRNSGAHRVTPPAADPLPAPKATAETPWTPPAPAIEPPQARHSGPHHAAPPAPEPPHAEPVEEAAAPAHDPADLPIHPEPAVDHLADLPPAQAWTPKKDAVRDLHKSSPRVAAVSTSAPVATAASGMFGHQEENGGGSKKGLVIGGAVAVIAAIAAVVVFVVKPFGAASAGEAAGTAASKEAMGTLSIDATTTTRVYIDDQPRGTTPLRFDVKPGLHRIRLESESGVVKNFEMIAAAGKETAQLVDFGKQVERADRAAAAAAAAAANAAAPAAPTPGFMTVDAPEELTLVEEGQVLGTSQAGKVSLAPGSHLIEFRNDSLGFQTTRTVQVLPGKTVRVQIPLPEGSLSINATPWAEVTLDGRTLGETPIANVTARAGSHELVFKHPQHGELKQTVVVKPGEMGRVTVNMVR
jgi:hypothetical protein